MGKGKTEKGGKGKDKMEIVEGKMIFQKS